MTKWARSDLRSGASAGEGRKRSAVGRAIIAALLVAGSSFVIGNTARANTASHSAVIILLDASGSMQRTDPERLRVEAVSLYLALLKDGDRVKLTQFGDNVRDLTGGFVAVNQQSRDGIRSAAAGCGAQDAHTDMLSALSHAERSVRQMDAEARASYSPIVLLLSDGQDDVPETTPGRGEAMLECVRSIAASGGVIHALGLSANADRAFLSQVANLGNGDLVLAQGGEDLPRAFFDLARSTGRRWLLNEEPVAGGTSEIPKPTWANELVVAYFGERRRPASLDIPSGAVLKYRSPSCTVFSVTVDGASPLAIALPSQPGLLIVEAQAEMMLHSELPRVVGLGLPFPARAWVTTVDGASPGDVLFLRRTVVTLHVGSGPGADSTPLYDDGGHNDGALGDGVFGGTIAIDSVGVRVGTVSLRAPYSPRLKDTAEFTVLAEALSFSPPHLFERIICGLAGMPSRVVAANGTDIGLTVSIWPTERVDESRTCIVPPRSSAAIAVPLRAPLFASARHKLLYTVPGRLQPALAVSVAVPPRATLPIVVVVAGAAIVATLSFPRRRLRNTILRIRVMEDPLGSEHTRTIMVTDDTTPNISDLPEPFGNPGTFAARHGLWRRGVVYRPAEWIRPVFKGKQARLKRDVWILVDGATWSGSTDTGVVTYTLQTRN